MPLLTINLPLTGPNGNDNVLWSLASVLSRLAVGFCVLLLAFSEKHGREPISSKFEVVQIDVCVLP